MNGEAMENVDNFIYMRTKISEMCSGNGEEEIRARRSKHLEIQVLRLENNFASLQK